MQILHPFSGSLQQYDAAIADPDRYRPDHCPQCEVKHPLTAHGFYRRTLVDVGWDSSIRVRRYLCRSCKRTVSLLPEFALPYLRFSIALIALFLVARLLEGRTLRAAAAAASQPHMPPPSAASFVTRGLLMLQALGWIAAHRFLFAELRCHLLGWPPFLAPHGRPTTLGPVPRPT